MTNGAQRLLVPLYLISRKEAIARLHSKTLFERMLYGRLHPHQRPWIRFVPAEDGRKRRETLIDARSIDEAIERLLAGEYPPLLPKKGQPE